MPHEIKIPVGLIFALVIVLAAEILGRKRQRSLHGGWLTGAAQRPCCFVYHLASSLQVVTRIVALTVFTVFGFTLVLPTYCT